MLPDLSHCSYDPSSGPLAQITVLKSRPTSPAAHQAVLLGHFKLNATKLKSFPLQHFAWLKSYRPPGYPDQTLGGHLWLLSLLVHLISTHHSESPFDCTQYMSLEYFCCFSSLLPQLVQDVVFLILDYFGELWNNPDASVFLLPSSFLLASGDLSSLQNQQCTLLLPPLLELLSRWLLTVLRIKLWSANKVLHLPL